MCKFSRKHEFQTQMIAKTHASLLLSLFFLLATASAEPIAMPPQAWADVAFSPGGQALSKIIHLVDSAKASVLVAAYVFTSKPIAEALVRAHRRKVKVYVVADAQGNSDQYTAITYLANQGVPTRVNSQYAILHSKYIVVDGLHVETGSFNFSASAQSRNSENVLILWNVPELAAQYSKNWQSLWSSGQDVRKKY